MNLGAFGQRELLGDRATPHIQDELSDCVAKAGHRSRCARIVATNALPSFNHVSSGRSFSRSTSTSLVPTSPWSSNSKHQQPLSFWYSFRQGSPIRWTTVFVLNMVSYGFVL